MRFFIYFDDGEVEYDADSAEEKNKVQLIDHYNARKFVCRLMLWASVTVAILKAYAASGFFVLHSVEADGQFTTFLEIHL